jgi:Uma2 family endonuclease
MATVTRPTQQALVLDAVDWATYGRLLRALGNQPAVRLTYDRGCLEIMALSHERENSAHLLGRLVVVITEELGLPVKGGRSTTFRMRNKRRGLEPDDCYWIANEPLVRGKNRIELRIDPPPDLAVEVDVSHSSLDRLAIYAALWSRRFGDWTGLPSCSTFWAPEATPRAPRAALSPASLPLTWVRFLPDGMRWMKTRWSRSFALRFGNGPRPAEQLLGRDRTGGKAVASTQIVNREVRSSEFPQTPRVEPKT